MFQRVALSRIFPSSRNLISKHSKRFSKGPVTDETNQSEALGAQDTLKTGNDSSYDTEEVLKVLEKSALFKDVNKEDWATSPYPKEVPLNLKDDERPSVDPKDTCILLFPGQGTIKVGAVENYVRFPGAKELFDIASEILNYDLLKLCTNGPQDKLNRTEFNQPATVVLSLAALEKIREEKPKVFDNCIAAAGYSIGEITALILSGVLTFEDGVRLACVRGKAMQHASDLTPQGMLSVSCNAQSKLFEACKAAEKWAMDMGVEQPLCKVAVYLCTQKKILAGDAVSLKYIEDHREEFYLGNVAKLSVSGAFHTQFMEPALKSVKKLLDSLEFDEPRCDVVSNYKAQPYSNMRLTKKYILKQIVSPVKWEQSMQNLYSRAPGMAFPQTFDVASGGRMKTILKLINSKAASSCTTI